MSISLQLDPRKLPGPKPAICTAKSRLLDHLVGAGDERWRHVEAERLGSDETGCPHALEQAHERLDAVPYAVLNASAIS